MTVATPETDTAPAAEFVPPVPDGPAAPVVINPASDPGAQAAAMAQQQAVAVQQQQLATTQIPGLPGALPAFEGAGVAQSVIATAGAAEIEHFGETLGMEDRLRLVGEFRVCKVTFEVDKNGDLVRRQYVKAVAPLMITPWDPADPMDTGIVRARPRP